jgi:hypothetical protein
VGPRTFLVDVERRKILTISGLQLRFLGRVARSQSLYRLSYPGSLQVVSKYMSECIIKISMTGTNAKLCVLNVVVSELSPYK